MVSDLLKNHDMPIFHNHEGPVNRIGGIEVFFLKPSHFG